LQNVSERIAALRTAMEKAGVQAYVVPSSDPHLSEYPPEHWKARRYFSGFTGSAGTLAVTREKSGLWTDGRYFIQAERELAGSGIELYRMGVRGVPACPAFLNRELPQGGTVGLDGALFSAADVREMARLFRKKGLKIRSLDLTGPLWENRPPMPHTEAFLHDVKYAGLTSAEKIALVRKKLQERGADSQVYVRLDCVAWLMNLRAGDVEDSPFAVAFAAVLPDEAVLFIDSSRVPERVAAGLRANGVTLRGYDEIAPFLQSMRGRKTVLTDPAGISYSLYRALKENPDITLREGPDLVTELKSVKNETELRSIRGVHVCDGCAMAEAFSALEEKLKNGEDATECTVCDLLAEARARQPDNRGISFGTIAAYRANAAMMHYAPKPGSCSRLARSGLLLVDSGGQYLGGTTDVTRTFALGPLTQEERKAYTLVLKAHIALATAVFWEGSTGGNIDILCREPVWKYGIDYRCGTGHGVGMFGNVHEGPQNLRRTDRTVFRRGMLITDEPGIYTEGKYGVRIENMMEVVDAFDNEYGHFLKFRPLTCFPIDTAPLLTGLLSDDELAWLNRYHKRVRETLAPHLSGKALDWVGRHTRPVSRASV